MSDIIEQLKNTLSEHPIILFMKGTPDFPQCGFLHADGASTKSL